MEDRFDLAPWELGPESPEKLQGVAQARRTASGSGDEREFLLCEVELKRARFRCLGRCHIVRHGAKC